MTHPLHFSMVPYGCIFFLKKIDFLWATIYIIYMNYTIYNKTLKIWINSINEQVEASALRLDKRWLTALGAEAVQRLKGLRYQKA